MKTEKNGHGSELRKSTIALGIQRLQNTASTASTNRNIVPMKTRPTTRKFQKMDHHFPSVIESDSLNEIRSALPVITAWTTAKTDFSCRYATKTMSANTASMENTAIGPPPDETNGFERTLAEPAKATTENAKNNRKPASMGTRYAYSKT